jgi:ribosome recycling factor
MKGFDQMKCTDTYKEVRVITFPGMIARVHIPDLTTEERSRRMKDIYKAAEKLLKGATAK